MSHKHEAGQTYIIFAMLMIGMLGFSAMAIDGGVIYHEHRRSQNAADAAALAAAYAKIQAQPLGTAALANAISNDYTTTAQNCVPAGLDCVLGIGPDHTIQVTNPPRSGEYAGNSEYIHVVINSTVETSFLHLIFPGGVQNQAEATSRVWPPQSFTPGYAIFATTPHDCKGVWFSGTGDTVASGGGVFSNSDAAANNCQSGVQDGGGNVTVQPPHQIESVGWFDTGGSGSVSPAPNEGVPPQELRPDFLPDCSGLPDYGNVSINGHGAQSLDPGRYSRIRVQAQPDLTLNPGMYCIYGSHGFNANGGTITGTGVMIYMQDGDFDLGGNTLVNLAAEQNPGVLVDPSHSDWKGMLLFVDPSNTNDIKITGTSNSTYTGTIYAPNQDVEINGTGDSLGLLSTQIIANSVKITGNAQLNITYNESEVFNLPSAIDLIK
jgi:Flp pilus assembly protein TadG